MREQVIFVYIIQPEVLRVNLLNEPTDDEVTLELAAEAQQKYNQKDYLPNIRHILEIGIQRNGDIADALIKTVIPHLLRQFANELPHRVVVLLEQVLTNIQRLALEFNRIGVCHELHLFVLVYDLLEADLLLVYLFEPLLGYP